MNLFKTIFKVIGASLMTLVLMYAVTKSVSAAVCLPKVYFDIVPTSTTTGTNQGSCRPTSVTFDSVTGKVCNPTITTSGLDCNQYLYTLGASKGGDGCYTNTNECLNPDGNGASFRFYYNSNSTVPGKCISTNHRYDNSNRDVDDPAHLDCAASIAKYGPAGSEAKCFRSQSECIEAHHSYRVFCDTRNYRCISDASLGSVTSPTNKKYSDDGKNIEMYGTATCDQNIHNPAYATYASSDAKCYPNTQAGIDACNANCIKPLTYSNRVFCDKRSGTCLSDPKLGSVTSPTNKRYSDDGKDIEENGTYTCFSNIHNLDGQKDENGNPYATFAMDNAKCFPNTQTGIAACNATCGTTNVVTPTPTAVPTAIPAPRGNSCSKVFTIVLATATATARPTTIPTATPVSSIRPTPTATPIIISCDKNLDIALMIDRSSSMNETDSGKIKLEWAKEAAKGFVDAIYNTGTGSVNVAVASFGAQGNDGTGTISDTSFNSSLNSVLTNTSTGYAVIQDAINGVNYNKWGTCVECGLRLGNGQLTNANNRKVGVLISDGMANHTWNGSNVNGRQAAIAMANSGRASGIEYRTIGYGSRTAGQIDESTLINIAGNATNYQYRPNVSEWSSSFLTVLKDLCAGTPALNPIASLTVTADASVYAGTNNSKNFGADKVLKVDGSPIVQTYMKLDLTSLNGKTIKNAVLKLKNTTSVDSLINVNSTVASWVENTIKYTNKPAAGTAVTSFKSGTSEYPAYVDLTEFVNANKGKVVSIVLTTTSADGYYFNSKEAATDKPTLIVY